MRLTLDASGSPRGVACHPTDVDVDPGVTIAALRPALARLSGSPGWADARQRIAVDDQPLDESHLAGQPPLVHGCVLRLGAGARGAAEEAMLQGWHVAVVAGPACGALIGLPDRVGTVVGPGLVVRRRGDRVTVRVSGAAQSLQLRQFRWPRRWRPGAPLTVDATTFALRRRTPEVPTGSPDAARPAITRPEPRPPAAVWLTPLVGSVALAAALRQPLLALVGLVGPLGALATSRRRPRPPAGLAGLTGITDPAALVAATVRADPEPRSGELPWDAGGALAVVGPRPLALPVARAAALAALGTHLAPVLAVRTRSPQDWSWCVWATTSDAPYPGAAATDGLVVVDDPPDPADVARWRARAPASHRVLVLAPSMAAVPAWCRSRLEVGPTDVRLHGPDGRVTVAPRHAVSAATALAQVRRAAGLAARAVGTELPDHAVLGALEGIPVPDTVAAAWALPRSGLRAPLGRGAAGGTVVVDLAADGPHALVAGTTGAGKSELLTTWVLALALTHPPDRLAVLLVDFKGGTGLGPVAGLPHVLEHVTDLDAPHALRVLAGLRAELRRRERVLVAAGARDLRELDPRSGDTPPRLLVVVDELRALTEDVPDAAAALARLAAQGRALGVHLVLATQRPAGAVGADLRANVSLRIALRVADAADSTDVLDAPDAARIDPATPGRALLRRGARALEPVQVARAVIARARPPVRAAPAWGSEPGWSPTRSSATGDDAVAAWVAAARRAAQDRPTGRTPWLPALPAIVRAPTDDDGSTGLILGVADLPEEQRRGTVRWDAAHGHLLVLGGPRSGRTTTLVTVGLAALARGWEVHTVGLGDEAVGALRSTGRWGSLGTVLDVDDACGTARLLELLEDSDSAADRPGAVLLVDQVEVVLTALGELARGAGADRLTALWHGGRGGSRRIAVAATAAAGPVSTQLAGAFRDRLVLPLADPVLDSLAGVPALFAGPRHHPGRAVHLHAGGAQLMQVALPGEPVAVPSPDRARSRGIVRLQRLPRHAHLPPDARAWTSGDQVHVPWGIGGDEATALSVDIGPGLLVAGSPGSGRSNALAVVALGLVRGGHRVARVLDPAAEPTAAIGGVHDLGVDALLAQRIGPAELLLVDDLDELERAHPEVGDLVATLLAGRGGPRVVATTTASSAVAAFRGALPALVRTRRLLVLDAHEPAAAELVGPRAAWLVDPRHRVPGRAVLVRGRDVTAVQVYAAPPATRHAAE